jgi:hypothetical protein
MLRRPPASSVPGRPEIHHAVGNLRASIAQAAEACGGKTYFPWVLSVRDGQKPL